MGTPSPVTHHLFSYGTLQLASVQEAIFGHTVAGDPDAIIGYTVDEVLIDDPVVIAASGSDRHPVLRYDASSTQGIEGTVYRLTDAQLAAADNYEVDAYHRVRVPLRSGIEAWVYVLRDV